MGESRRVSHGAVAGQPQCHPSRRDQGRSSTSCQRDPRIGSIGQGTAHAIRRSCGETNESDQIGECPPCMLDGTERWTSMFTLTSIRLIPGPRIAWNANAVGIDHASPVTRLPALATASMTAT